MESGLDGNAAELAAETENFVSKLMTQRDREQVASEIGGEYLWFPISLGPLSESVRRFPLAVLQSIYGDDAIHLWHGSGVGSPEHTSDQSSPSNGADTIRYVISLKYMSRSFLFLLFFPLIDHHLFISLDPPIAALIVFHRTRTCLSAFSFLYLLHTPPRAHHSCNSFRATSVPLASIHLSLDRHFVLLYPYPVLNGPPTPFASLTDFRASSSYAKYGTKTSSTENGWGSLFEKTLPGAIQHHKNRCSRQKRTWIQRNWEGRRNRHRLSRM